jgi:tetratricopeptide (TPR) repeat protein
VTDAITPAAPAAAPQPEGAAEALAQGLSAFAARDLEAAHRLFERAHRRDPRHPRAMSWYGVTLVLVERNSALGVSLCDQAVRQCGPEPELALNQARVHLSLNQRERAVKALFRALEARPGEPSLLAAQAAMGVRRPPVIGFLSRGNPLNRLLGRLRHRWLQRQGAAGAAPRILEALPGPPALAPPPEPDRS